ncbi:MAG: hypothetical protein M3O34_16995 [Chloroflexota bacterium]|nr:hypothetical protein [Chloroflexota bacterium]
MIRPLRPTDLVGVGMFLRRADVTELTSHTWPKVQPECGRLPTAIALRQPLGLGPGWGRAWVATDDGALTGLLVARGRAGGLVWDVEHLHAVAGRPEVAASLLDAVSQDAVSGGARRLFIDMGAGEAGAHVARRAGFERYTGVTIYRLDPPFSASRGDNFYEGRPRLRADEHALFSLYNAAVPAIVRSAEAMTYDEWSALHRGRRRWAPTLVGDRHQYVWELGEGLAGWLEVVYGQRSQYLEVLIHPKFETMLDRFIGYALKQTSEKAPVYSTAREYQAGLGTALERFGFKEVACVDVFVRQLTVRVPECQFVPAKIAGG